MQHRIRIRSLLLVWGWGMIWTHFLKNIHFGRAVVWCEPDDHPFFQSIHSAKYLCFCSSFTSSSWCYMAKVQRSIPSSNQQRRPLPSLLSYSYFIFHFLKSIYPRAKATTYLLHIYNSILVHYLLSTDFCTCQRFDESQNCVTFLNRRWVHINIMFNRLDVRRHFVHTRPCVMSSFCIQSTLHASTFRCVR